MSFSDQVGVEVLECANALGPVPVSSGAETIADKRHEWRCRLSDGSRCMPSILAERWCRFRSWSYTLSLSAPAGCFWDWWERADLESVLVQPWLSARSVAGQLAAPFWVRSLAWQPGSVRDPRLLPRDGEVHAHLVLGNVSEELLGTLKARWPEGGRFVRSEVVYDAYGALHYALSQTRVADDRSLHFARVKLDHHLGHDALVTWPRESPSIDLHVAVTKLAPKPPVTPEVRARFVSLAHRRWARA